LLGFLKLLKIFKNLKLKFFFKKKKKKTYPTQTKSYYVIRNIQTHYMENNFHYKQNNSTKSKGCKPPTWQVFKEPFLESLSC
jgi:ribonuclease HI